MVDRIMMNQRRAAPAPGAESLGQHFQHALKFLARQVAIGISRAGQFEEFLLFPGLARGARDDLLREQIEGLFRDSQTVQLALADAAQRGNTLDKFVAAQRKHAALRQTAAFVLRPANALQKGGDGTGRPELADQIDRADVDTQFQRGRGHQRLEFPAFQLVFRVEPQAGRQAAVMRGNPARAQPLRQMMRDAFGQPSRIDEHERRPVLLD